MTGEERYNELYDEMENLARKLVEMFDADRFFDKDGEKSRTVVNLDLLMGRIAALDDVRQEMKFLQKFRGSLRLIP